MLNAAERLADLEAQLVECYTEELRDGLPSLGTRSEGILATNPENLRPGERGAAEKFEQQAPDRERQLHSALDFLEFAPHRHRVGFLTGDWEERQAMIQKVLADGGVADAGGRFKWTG